LLILFAYRLIIFTDDRYLAAVCSAQVKIYLKEVYQLRTPIACIAAL
jgi:hypothetical protein